MGQSLIRDVTVQAQIFDVIDDHDQLLGKPLVNFGRIKELIALQRKKIHQDSSRFKKTLI